MEKYSDIGHIKRTLTHKLEDLQERHKTLTAAVRSDIIKNFTYAFHQNKENSEADMKNSISSIIPHMYGDHGACGSWCRFDKDDNYKHSFLPYGRDLTDSALKNDLEIVMSPFILNPQKLMTTGQSQANEALNNVAWSKAPKIRNYNQSESFDYRCTTAVCQFTDGNGYVDTVCEKAGLTPQKKTHKYNRTKDLKRKYLKNLKSMTKNKRRQIELKQMSSRKELTYAIKEGTTYEKDCILNDDQNIDIRAIPDEIILEPPIINSDNVNFIFYDLETTKLGSDAEITQLGAITSDGLKFSMYVMPQSDITKKHPK